MSDVVSCIENSGELLREAQRSFQSSLDSAGADVAVLDSTGFILAASQGLNLGGESVPLTVGDDYLTACALLGLDAKAEGLTRDGLRSIAEGRRPDFYFEYSRHIAGFERWFAMNLARFGDAEPPRVLLAHWEKKEKTRAESELREQTKRLQILRSFFDSLHETQDLVSVLQKLNETLPTQMGISRTSVLLYDEKSDSLVSGQLLGMLHLDQQLLSAPQPIGYSISGQCYSTGKPVVVQDCSETDLIPREYVDYLQLKSTAAIPIKSGSKVVGVLRADDTARTFRFDGKDLEFLTLLANQLGIVIHNARLLAEKTLTEDKKRDPAAVSQTAASDEAILRLDPLTGIPTSPVFMEILDKRLKKDPGKSGPCCAVMLVNIDRFSRINQSLGNDIGDELLIALARRLSAALKQRDALARLEGAEFAILLDDQQSEDAIRRNVHYIQKLLHLPFSLHNEEVFCTASLGISLSSTGYVHPSDLLRHAEIALASARREGSGRTIYFGPEMLANAVLSLQLEADLRRASSRGELEMYFQPIVRLNTRVIVGFESLIRWHHPTQGLMGPDELIPIAEETGLIIPIGWWVLRESCRQMREWKERFKLPEHFIVSVNLSAQQFAQQNLISSLKVVFKEYDFDPKMLALELTEGTVMQNADGTEHLLEQLKSLGLQLYIDDFGTGYSSLSYLERFPIDKLKIDQSFIAKLGAPGSKPTIVRTILDLAHNLGVQVIAEGVETKEQLAQLQALGCEFGQGYFLHRPLDATAAADLLASRRSAGINNPG